MHNVSHSLLQEITTGLYEEERQRLSVNDIKSDMSRSNRCATLTKGFWQALDARGIQSRRELHQVTYKNERLWHFIIAHAPFDQAPHQDDIITDLNPWLYAVEKPFRTGYLHGSRREVQSALHGDLITPPEFLALRGLETIIESHTLNGNTFKD